jgi:hypothetical protein
LEELDLRAREVKAVKEEVKAVEEVEEIHRLLDDDFLVHQGL